MHGGVLCSDWQESMLEESQNHREDFRIEGEGELVRVTN